MTIITPGTVSNIMVPGVYYSTSCACLCCGCLEPIRVLIGPQASSVFKWFEDDLDDTFFLLVEQLIVFFGFADRDMVRGEVHDP